MKFLNSLYQLLRPAFLPALVVAVLVVIISSFGSRATDQTLARVLCIMMVVIGTYIFVGNSGIISFGQVSFMAIGAYSMAILTMRPRVKANFLPDLPVWLIELKVDPYLVLIITAVLVFVIAFFLAIPLMRLSGLAAGIASLALLGIVYETISNASGWTGGQQTLLGVARAPSIYIILGFVLASMAVAAIFQGSRFGLMLRASRDEINAAASLGVQTVKLRAQAFILSAIVVAAGGALYAQVIRTVSASSFYIDMTATTLAMLVVGGMRSLSGAVAGVIVIAFILDFVRRLEQGSVISSITLPSGLTEVIVGFTMLSMLLLYPAGLTRGREFFLDQLFKKKKEQVDSSRKGMDDG